MDFGKKKTKIINQRFYKCRLEGKILINENIDKIFNQECLKLINSKNNDYANPSVFYANFRLAEQAGVPMFLGVHIRLLDKVSRLNSFLERFQRTGKMTTEHESIEDTLLDLINYSAIELDTYRQWKKKITNGKELDTDNNDIPSVYSMCRND